MSFQNNIPIQMVQVGFIKAVQRPTQYIMTSTLKQWAFRQDQWQEVPSFSPAKNAAVYRIQETTVSRKNQAFYAEGCERCV